MLCVCDVCVMMKISIDCVTTDSTLLFQMFFAVPFHKFGFFVQLFVGCFVCLFVVVVVLCGYSLW